MLTEHANPIEDDRERDPGPIPPSFLKSDGDGGGGHGASSPTPDEQLRLNLRRLRERSSGGPPAEAPFLPGLAEPGGKLKPPSLPPPRKFSALAWCQRTAFAAQWRGTITHRSPLASLSTPTTSSPSSDLR